MDARVWESLHAAGVEAQPLTPEDHGADLLLRFGEQEMLVQLKTYQSQLSPSDVKRLAAADRARAPIMLVVPGATVATEDAAVALGWSLVRTGDGSDARPGGVVVLPDGSRVRIGAEATSEVTTEPARPPGRVGWGSLTVQRCLLNGVRGTQAELAQLAGVTQARVSQTLKDLAAIGLVDRDNGQWRCPPGSWDGLLTHWLSVYPGPLGVSTFWYGLSTPREQALTAVNAVHEGRGLEGLASQGFLDAATARQVVVSGDVAADDVAAWRRPRLAVVYARKGTDLARQGLTPTGYQEATLTFTVPADRGIWVGATANQSSSRPQGIREGQLPLADPIQILWDLAHAPGPDADQAFDRMKTAVRPAESRSV